jgi:hypothetical protein
MTCVFLILSKFIYRCSDLNNPVLKLKAKGYRLAVERREGWPVRNQLQLRLASKRAMTP